MQATEIEALKTVVSDVLLKRGVLSNLKAQLRAAVFTTLHEQESVNDDFASTRIQELLQSPNGLVVLDLVKEFLQFYGMNQTLSVFNIEANIPSEKVDRVNLLKRANSKDTNAAQPALFSVLNEKSKPVQSYDLSTIPGPPSSPPPTKSIAIPQEPYQLNSAVSPPSKPSAIVDAIQTQKPASNSDILSNVSSITKPTSPHPITEKTPISTPPVQQQIQPASAQINNTSSTPAEQQNTAISIINNLSPVHGSKLGPLGAIPPLNTKSSLAPIPSKLSPLEPLKNGVSPKDKLGAELDDLMGFDGSFSTRVHARTSRQAHQPAPTDIKKDDKSLEVDDILEDLGDVGNIENESEFLTSDRSVTPTHALDGLDHTEVAEPL